MISGYWVKFKKNILRILYCMSRAMIIAANKYAFFAKIKIIILNFLGKFFPRYLVKLKNFYWYQRNKKYQSNELPNHVDEVFLLNQYMEDVIEYMRSQGKFKTIK